MLRSKNNSTSAITSSTSIPSSSACSARRERRASGKWAEADNADEQQNPCWLALNCWKRKLQSERECPVAAKQNRKKAKRQIRAPSGNPAKPPGDTLRVESSPAATTPYRNSPPSLPSRSTATPTTIASANNDFEPSTTARPAERSSPASSLP